jgi:hypothetical protein
MCRHVLCACMLSIVAPIVWHCLRLAMVQWLLHGVCAVPRCKCHE